jgi:hypothetical protein
MNRVSRKGPALVRGATNPLTRSDASEIESVDAVTDEEPA